MGRNNNIARHILASSSGSTDLEILHSQRAWYVISHVQLVDHGINIFDWTWASKPQPTHRLHMHRLLLVSCWWKIGRDLRLIAKCSFLVVLHQHCRSIDQRVAIFGGKSCRMCIAIFKLAMLLRQNLLISTTSVVNITMLLHTFYSCIF